MNSISRQGTSVENGITRRSVVRAAPVRGGAVRGGEIVAIASFRTPEGEPVDTVKLYQFHVSPDHWRAGLGSALHAACAERWVAAGRRTAVLDVHADNRRAQAFYACRGWVPDPERPPAEDDHHLFLRWTPPGNERTCLNVHVLDGESPRPVRTSGREP